MMHTRNGGFSLLEAIVALTILSAAMLGAYGWIANDIGALNKVRELALEEAAVRQALDRLEQTDLAQQPSGNMLWRDFRVEWNAVPLEPPRQGRTSVGGVGLYDLSLQQVRLAVYSRERLIASPEVRIVQHTLVRDAQFEQ